MTFHASLGWPWACPTHVHYYGTAWASVGHGGLWREAKAVFEMNLNCSCFDFSPRLISTRVIWIEDQDFNVTCNPCLIYSQRLIRHPEWQREFLASVKNNKNGPARFLLSSSRVMLKRIRDSYINYVTARSYETYAVNFRCMEAKKDNIIEQSSRKHLHHKN